MFNQYYNQNILPPQQVLTANGKASVDQIRLAPNSSVFVMDTTAPMIWLCVSDSLGNVSATPYDISIHTETVAVETASMEDRIAALEENIKKLMEGKNESDVIAVKPKQTRKPDAAD